MTAMEFRLSPRALRALGSYVEDSGLGIDEAVEDLVLRGSGTIPQRAEPVDLEMLPEKKRRFLELLLDLGAVSEACEAAVISQGLPYGWARSDLEFARAFDEVRQSLRDVRKNRSADSLMATAV